MIQKITKAPTRYYQLVALNIGLMIALCKGMTLLSIISSLIFIALALAPVAIALGILTPPPHQIISEEVCNKFKACHQKMCDSVEKWQQEEPEKKVKLPIQFLLAIYISYSVICPCIENFLIVNMIFVYFFMEEEFEKARSFLCQNCEKLCSLKLCGKK